MFGLAFILLSIIVSEWVKSNGGAMRVMLCCLLLLSSAFSAAEEALQIAVASNFTSTMQQLAVQFEQQTGHRTTVSYASTGKLFAQISNGAPFDLLLAADRARPRRLESLGLIAPGKRFTYAKGEVVLWAPHAHSTEEALQQLQQGDFNYLAIANPKIAPYGAAAMETMAKLGINNRYMKRIARGENIAQTYQFVYSGNAEMGFVAKSQVVAAGDALRGVVWQVPRDMYTSIEQQAVLLKRAEDNPVAHAFFDFLSGEVAQKTIAATGYNLISPIASSY